MNLILLPLIFCLAIWAYRFAFGDALLATRNEMNWRRYLGDLAIVLAMLFAAALGLDQIPATRRCFLLVDSSCPVPGGELIGEVGFGLLFLWPLSVSATAYALVEVFLRFKRRRAT